MTLWPLLTLIFIVQEPISSSVIMLRAYQAGDNVWFITLLFSIITIAEIIAAYYLGIWIENKFGQRAMMTSIKKRLDRFSDFIGSYGKIVALIVVVPQFFPVAGVFVPWFDISLTEAIIYIFIGELIFWYAYEWLLVLGVNSFVDPRWALIAILGVSLVITIGIRMMMKKSKKIGK